MPCEDTTAEIEVIIDKEERLVSYKYEKMTCGKNIGIGELYTAFASGKAIDYLSELSFEEVLKKCDPANKDEEFLLYMEWMALREALRAYAGKDSDADPERYKIAEIIAEEDVVIIKMIIYPPPDLPKPVPCGEQGANN